MNILFTDDKESSISHILNHFKGEEYRVFRETESEKIISSITINDIDLVVLDWSSSGNKENNNAGDFIIKHIWDKSFIPVVVFSAFSDQIKDSVPNHYFICNISKNSLQDGEGLVEDLVINKIEEYERDIKILKSFKSSLNENFKKATNVLEDCYDLEDEVKNYMLINQISSSYMDETINKDLPGWSIYLSSSSKKELLTGDIIENKESNEKLIIMSPSCDMEQKKITRVLCAKIIDGVTYAGIPNKFLNGEGEIHNKGWKNGLNELEIDNYLILPKYKNVLKPSLVDIKNIEIIDIDKIEKNETKEGSLYSWILSIASPYRERYKEKFFKSHSRIGVQGLRNKDILKDFIDEKGRVLNENSSN